jgi:hypothetical protein
MRFSNFTRSDSMTAAVAIALSCAAAMPALAAEPIDGGRPISTAEVHREFQKQQDDVSTVIQVVLRERQGRDRGWWPQMMDTYWPDSRVDLSWYHGDGPGFVYGSRTLYERGARPVHRMFAPVVDIKGNKAHVEAPTLTFSSLLIQGKQAHFETAMRLNYRLEKRGSEWRILSMRPVYEYATVRPAVPGETIVVPPEELAKYRPAYSLLSWNMAQRGIDVAQDELGIDRPEELDAFYAEIRKWLNS